MVRLAMIVFFLLSGVAQAQQSRGAIVATGHDWVEKVLEVPYSEAAPRPSLHHPRRFAIPGGQGHSVGQTGGRVELARVQPDTRADDGGVRGEPGPESERLVHRPQAVGREGWQPVVVACQRSARGQQVHYALKERIAERGFKQEHVLQLAVAGVSDEMAFTGAEVAQEEQVVPQHDRVGAAVNDEQADIVRVV